MKINRSRISVAALFALLFLAASACAQPRRDASDQYREAYITLQDALKLSYENKKEEALERYEEARNKLKDILKQFPDMNRETIEARIAKCEEAIDGLREEVSASSPVVEPVEAPAREAAGIPSEDAMAEVSFPAAPQPDTVAFTRVPENLTTEAEVAELQQKLRGASTDIETIRGEKAAVEAELEKSHMEAERMRREIQNINTSLGMAIADLEKEREVKAKIEEDAMTAQSSSEEILKSHLSQAIADKKKVEKEAMEAYRASEEIMRDQLDKQAQLQTIEQEKQKSASGTEAETPPIEQLHEYIDAYRQEVENARSELNESLKLIAASQETHRRLLEANREMEKRITALSESVSETEEEAELVELRKTADAEEAKLKKPDITRGPLPPGEASPSETQVLAGEISEKNDEYGKVFIDLSTDVKEGEELLVVRDNEVIARLKVSKVFPSIKGGIANVTPKEDAYELREKDKVYAVRQDPPAPR